MTGYIHRLESLGTLDGPGVRAVIFASGCPLRCIYCHNPDTQARGGEAIESEVLAAKIERLYPYIKDGGVTFSGGEPLLQAEFFAELAVKLKALGLHIACDTSGCILNEAAKELLSLCDLLLLDLKFTTEEDYKKYTGGSLRTTLDFLAEAQRLCVPTVIRHVTVPGINDSKEDLVRLCDLLLPYRDIIDGVELLPFRKLCLEKYDALGIPFPLRDTPEMDAVRCRELQNYVNSILKN